MDTLRERIEDTDRLLDELENSDDRMLNDIAKAKAIGGRVIVITDSPASISGMADHLIIVPSIGPVAFCYGRSAPTPCLSCSRRKRLRYGQARSSGRD